MPTQLTAAPAVYKKLVSDIAALYQGARKALAEASWKIGQRIVKVEQNGAIRAKYGSSLLRDLSRDLTKRFGVGFSERNLERMRAFYLTSPISTPASKLNWAQQVELLQIRDKKTRLVLQRRAENEELTRDDLRKLVRKEVSSASQDTLPTGRQAKYDIPNAKVELLVPPQDLTPHTYKKGEIASKTGYVIDCGFYVYREVTKAQYESVTVTDKPSYTYEAVVERVIDGDSVPRKTAREMRADPSEPICGNGLQTTLSGFG